MAEDRKREPFLVLPCVESLSQADRFAALRAAQELTMLAAALPSTLLFRVQSESPDAIVIGSGEAFLARMGDRRALRQMFSETPAVLLTTDPGPELVRSAARMKIYSVLPMVATTQQMVAAIAATVAGFAVTLPQLSSGPDDTIAVAEDLTAREVEVLRLMARGQRNKQVATVLGISEHTAKFHVSSVLAKLGARTRTEAVTIGVMRGLVAI